MSFADVSALAVTIPSENRAATFERLVTVARGRGYVPVDVAAAEGRFSVEAQNRARPTEVIRFTVQCYRNGFAELIPSGPRVNRRGRSYHLPSAAAQEYRELALAMRAALRLGSQEVGVSSEGPPPWEAP
jgi:hypothetical protein